MNPSVSWSEMQRLFTMTFLLDRDLKMDQVSSLLSKRCPSAIQGANLEEVFRIHRPQGVHGFDELANNLDTLVLLISNANDMALRGQLVRVSEHSARLMFVGSPWLPWMAEHNPDAKLGLGDFPRHDPQMDSAFYEATQKSMFKDLESVNSELRLAKEQAEHAHRSQSDFFAVMSHEMRTPLNGVITALSLNRDTSSKREKQDLLKVAYTSANNLMSVINYVLDYSKLESGSLDIEQEEFDLLETVSSVGEILQMKAKAKRLELNIVIDSDVPRWVRGDGSKIRQVLINLVSNAVKFTTNGYVNIKVTSEYVDERSEQVIFVVEDSGEGIAPEDEGRIFDAFWSSKSTTASGDANTGLGLNICKRITDLLGGQLTYSSTLGEGSRFVLDIELERMNERETAKETTDLAQLFVGDVLLVDDNQANLYVGTLMLERMGLSVRSASDGREAVQLALAHRFDLILMDITMPIMDGETAAKLLREEGSDTPIVALTAHVGEELVERISAAGMQGIVHKPINKAELIRSMGRFLETTTSKTSSHGLANSALVDQEVLQTLISNIGEANFTAASALFIKEMQTRGNAIKSAWVQRNIEVMGREAHTLKSSAASFGAAEFSSQMATLEAACREGDMVVMIDYMPKLDLSLQESVVAYQQEVNEFSAK